MRDELKVQVTAYIWAAFTLVCIATVAGGQFNFLTAIVLGGCAFMATAAVWDQLGNDKKRSETDEAEKAKRRGRVDRMLDKLDDHELRDLRARLMADNDGEAVSLDEVLEARRRE
jgi:hypothetical protein